MQGEGHYCYYCMEKINEGETCPFCGHNNRDIQNEYGQLPPGTIILNSRIDC